MFRNSAKANWFASGRTRLGLTLALALSMIVPSLFSYSTAQAGTVAGEFCIEGIVIDWEEQPMGGLLVGAKLLGNSSKAADAASEGMQMDDMEIDEAELEALAAELDAMEDVEALADAEAMEAQRGSVFFTISSGADDDDYNGDNDDLDEGEFEFTDLEPGYWLVGVRPPRVGNWEGVTPLIIVVKIEAGREDCAQVRFKLRQLVEVNVLKINENHEGLYDWVIEARPGPGNFFAEVQEETTDRDGYAYFQLTPGNWIFAEQAPEPDNGEMKTMFTPIAPPQGKMELDVQPGEPYTIRFKNRLDKDGCLLVEKVDDQGYGLAGWGIKVLRKDGSVAASGMTDAEGFVKFDNLPRGPYTVVEEERAGWASEVGTAIDVNVEGNGCQTTGHGDKGAEMNGKGDYGSLIPDVTFMNVQTYYGYCIEGRKIDVNGGVGIAGWEITAEPLDKGGYELRRDTIETDGEGKFRFDFPMDDYRVPGSQYEICEDEVDGWIAKSPICRTVTLPKMPDAQCVLVNDFVNMQVGHDKANEKWGMEGGKEMGGMQGGMEMGRPSMEGPKQPMHCTTYHVVQKGEGLFEIGADYKVSPQAMVDANPWVREQPNYWVYAGQKLCIP
ncbi:MAG: LysM peptidoglycan-binding domain-containing protein [Caldilineaceae bacterium]|nr:LysM peptidoglycan-binding domain-containing protein [Caldilineaceae bacterium]